MKTITIVAGGSRPGEERRGHEGSGEIRGFQENRADIRVAVVSPGPHAPGRGLSSKVS
ncbi:MAG: hypothetical protein R6V85_21135 [Polyangia bacterium]